MRMGFYQPRPPFPFTPGYEVSGVVDALGENASGVEVGQKVVAAMRNGGQASFVVAPVDRVIPLPEGISLEAAASTPVTYMTAHHMLHHLGHLQPEDKVLIHGGAGGVGTAALQLCKWAGVKQVWATSSKPSTAPSSSNTALAPSTGTTRILKPSSNQKPTEQGLTTSLTPSVETTSAEASPASLKVDGSTPMGCRQRPLPQTFLVEGVLRLEKISEI